jgi:mannonate dehydratase
MAPPDQMAWHLFAKAGLDVSIRVDHVPTLEGEDHSNHGYAVLGRLFAIGYMKGIMDAFRIEYR